MIYMDKNNDPFEIKAFCEADHASLSEMYDFFRPKAKFQGMPPEDPSTRRSWLTQLEKNGRNFLAWRPNKVIGHGVLLPDFDKMDAEYLIFVLQSDRGQGIGREITRYMLQYGADLGIKVIWLTVNAYNFRATKLYSQCGFKFSSNYRSASERMMLYEYGVDHAA